MVGDGSVASRIPTVSTVSLGGMNSTTAGDGVAGLVVLLRRRVAAGPGRFIRVVVASAGRYAAGPNTSLLNGQMPVVLKAACIVVGLNERSLARE